MVYKSQEGSFSLCSASPVRPVLAIALQERPRQIGKSPAENDRSDLEAWKMSLARKIGSVGVVEFAEEETGGDLMDVLMQRGQR